MGESELAEIDGLNGGKKGNGEWEEAKPIGKCDFLEINEPSFLLSFS